VQVGVPLQVYRELADTFVAKFLGNPPMNLFKVSLEASADGVAARFGHHVLPLPAMDVTKLTAYINQTVILGIRPEDLSEIRPQDRHQHPNGFTARVAAVEALGAETVLIMEIEAVDEVVRARLDRDSTARLGDEICIEADVNRVHLFDPESSWVIACRRQ